MRIQPYGVGSVVHVVKRGARGIEISRDEHDRMRFVRALYILNDEYKDRDWTRRESMNIFDRPDDWPVRIPLVSVLAWTLMPNHFHLLLLEHHEGGVSKFMQRLAGSMTTAFNEKYGETGSIFQGPFRSRTVDQEEYLRYVYSYIVVKNVFELYPGGLLKALEEFDTAWRWAESYPFSSFRDHILNSNSPILNWEKLQELDLPGSRFKTDGYDMLSAHVSAKGYSEDLLE